MSEIVKNGQLFSVVPEDFKNANKGKVVDVGEKTLSIEVIYPPTGIMLNIPIEFYSQTSNGVLYFQSTVSSIDNNILTVLNPIKHRFLQRRQFTRVKFYQEMDFRNQDASYKIKALDLSAGGMRLTTKDSLNINLEYDVNIELSHERVVNCKFLPIRIEKADDGVYTLSGRFQNLSNVDKMTLVQFCMNKDAENVNK